MEFLSNDSIPCGHYLPPQQRIVLFIIDGLRYDFVNTTQNHYFPYLHHLLNHNKSQSKLWKFIADPPTVTAQRLKGLTTGTLPTFIDIGSNLNSSAISDDNVIDQLRWNYPLEEIVVLGDDTWTALFPHHFHHVHVFDSFNTKDLDTVDNGIWNLLPSYLANPSSWRLLILHFLGVDHVGHTFDISHPAMRTRLEQYDETLKQVVSSLPEDGMIWLFGDHGMTAEGEHGGASPEEVTTALFVYSKQSLPITETQEEDVIPQIDLVPSIASLLHVPIPFSSLGRPLTLAFPQTNPILRREIASRAALQVWRFLMAYFADLTEAMTRVESLRDVLRLSSPGNCLTILEDQAMQWTTTPTIYDAQKLLYRAVCSHYHNLTTAERIIEEYDVFISAAQDAAREIWTSFRPLYAIPGIVLMSLACAVWIGKLASTCYMREQGLEYAMGGMAAAAVAFSNSFIVAEAEVTFIILQLTLLSQWLRSGRQHRWLALLMAHRCLLGCVHGLGLAAWPVEGVALAHIACCGVLGCLLWVLMFRGHRHQWKGAVGPAPWLYLIAHGIIALRHMPNWRSTGASSIPDVRAIIALVAALLICGALQSVRRVDQVMTMLAALHCLVALFLPCPHQLLVLDLALLLLALTLWLSSLPPSAVGTAQPPYPLWTTAYVLQWSRWVFFLTDHALRFDKLHLNAAFIGADTFSIPYATAVLIVNTSGTDLLAIAVLALLAAAATDRVPRESPVLALMALLIPRMVATTAATMAAWILRRHLMVWAVFAPKVLFEVALFVVFAIAAIGVWVFIFGKHMTWQSPS